MLMPTPSQLRIGLRFDRRDARALRQLAARAQRRELGEEAVTTFAAAAEAAETGEPLIVVCESRLEPDLMAAGYVRFGIRRPVLDELS